MGNPLPLNGGSYQAFSTDVNVQRTVNWYPEVDQSGLSQVVLYPTPGCTSFTTAGNGAIRGAIVAGNYLYVVSGSDFYRVDTGGVAVDYGNLSTASGRVSMAYNGTQILIVDGTKGYLFNVGTLVFTADLGAITNFPDGATSAAFIDGYFVVNDILETAGTPGAFYISSLYNGLIWAALDFDVASRSPDPILDIKVAQGLVWLIGQETTELWYNSGNPDFPFERVSSAIIDHGTIAGPSVAELEGNLIWLNRTKTGQGQVVMSQGTQVSVVSDYALNAQLASYSTLADAFAFAFTWKGHEFYVLTLPTANKTWVLDLRNQVSFQWCYNGSDTRHLSNCYAYFNTTHVIGSKDDGTLLTLEDDVYTDNGTTITRLRQTGHLHQNGKKLFVNALELLFEQGVANGSFPDPQVMVQWSKDRGHTWQSENWRSMLGATGEYSKASTIRRIGRCETITFRIKITDGVKAVMAGANVYMTDGSMEVT